MARGYRPYQKYDPSQPNTGSVLSAWNVSLRSRLFSATADFQVAMSEMLLAGFPVGAIQIASSPDCVKTRWQSSASSPQAAGSGYAPPAEVTKALNYLARGQSYGGRYVLAASGRLSELPRCDDVSPSTGIASTASCSRAAFVRR